MPARTLSAAAAGVLLACLSGGPAGAATTFANCTAMHKKYPHGVGKSGARDLISGRYIRGKSVTTFKVSTALYTANKKSDRDKDGVACEQKELS